MSSLTEQRIQQRQAELLFCFETIQQERMADVPILNDRLKVETVGFRHWNGYALGVLITPWVMKLVALPLLKKDMVNKSRHWAFPSGEYTFDYEQLDELGECYSCSLFSPMQEFEDQIAAIATAEAVMQGLFAGEENEQQQLAKQLEQQALNRRQFLRGRLTG